VTRRWCIPVLAALVLSAALSATADAQSGDEVGFGGLQPASGPPGTEISYTVVGTPDADTACRGSSAFTTEFLDDQGLRLGTGANTIAVPEGALAGPAFVRLVCYVPDETGRRVIYGLCASFEVTAPGGTAGTSPAPAGGTVNAPCPASPRLVMSESTITTQNNLGRAFNAVLTAVGA
jgi:hypothetical protein